MCPTNQIYSVFDVMTFQKEQGSVQLEKCIHDSPIHKGT